MSILGYSRTKIEIKHSPVLFAVMFKYFKIKEGSDDQARSIISEGNKNVNSD